MKKNKTAIFNEAYKNSDMYYGWDVRHEFKTYIDRFDLKTCHALDLGAGEGRYSLYLAGRGCTVTALDFSSAGLQKLGAVARQRELTVSTVLTDLKNYVFKEATYDLVVAATILDHLDTVLRNKTIAGIINTLKPGGILYANVFTSLDPGYKARKTASHNHIGVSDTASCIEHYFENEELKYCFSDMKIIYYYEGVEPDMSHGTPHSHGWASLIAEKPSDPI